MSTVSLVGEIRIFDGSRAGVLSKVTREATGAELSPGGLVRKLEFGVSFLPPGPSAGGAHSRRDRQLIELGEGREGEGTAGRHEKGWKYGEGEGRGEEGVVGT